MVGAWVRTGDECDGGGAGAGEVHELDGLRVVATVHPSSILRAGERRETEHAAFVDDLRAVRRLLDAA